MTDAITLTDGSISIPLVYNASNTYQLKIRYGTNIAALEPSPIWHRSDQEEPQLVENIPQNRTAIFNVSANNTTDTTNANALIVLQRLLDQAERYQLTGIGPRVTLNVTLNGLSNATVHEVCYGVIEAADRDGIHAPQSRLNTVIFNMQVRLVLKPYGESASVITLKNEVKSSPHFIEDSNDDGLADGWNLSATPPDSYSLDTSFWLAFGQAQKFACNATGTKGIYCDTITVAQSTQVVAYFWLRTFSTSTTADTIYVRLLDGSSNLIQEKAFKEDDAAPAVSDKSIEGQDGGTWYRVVLTGTNSTAANIILSVSRKSADGSASNTTVLVQCAYLQTGTGTAPDAWCSTSNNVHTQGSLNAEDEINYIDTCFIPGDAPAEVAYYLANSSAHTAIFSHLYEGQAKLNDISTWKDVLSGSGPRWSTGTAGTYTGTAYYTYNDNDSSGTAIITATFNASTSIGLGYYQWDAYAIVDVANTAITCDAQVLAGQNVTLLSNVALNNAGAWYAIRVGTFNIRDVAAAFDSLGTSDVFDNFNLQLSFDVSGGTYGADAVKVDAVFLQPTYGKASCNYGSLITNLGIDYKRGAATTGASRSYIFNNLISKWGLIPGVTANRFYNVLYNDENYSFTVDTNSDITINILPRTRYLFGNI